MELNHELKSKRKMTESGGMAYNQSIGELVLNNSNNSSDFSMFSRIEVTESETDTTDPLKLSSLSGRKAGPISKLRSLPVTEPKKHQSLIAFEYNLDMIESEVGTKKKIISSILSILRSHAAETFCSTENKNTEYFYTLFQESISNFIIEGFESLVVDSLTDILLPASNWFSEVGLELDFENLRIIQSILYYYLVGVTPINTLSLETSFLNLDSGDRESSFLLPISKAISEVDYAWLTKQNYPELVREFKSVNGGFKLEYVKDVISIFTQEQIPNLIIKIINNLKSNYLFAKYNNIIEESCTTYLYTGNPLMGDVNQTPFFIGRLLEICFSKSQKDFTSIFLQLDGPLVIMPFMYYSSMQDFFLRFFGFIGNNYRRECKYNEFSNSILDFDYPESTQESSIGEFDTDKSQFCQEQYLNVGISPIIYEWIIESDFIQNLLFPLLNIVNYGQEDLSREPKLRKVDVIDSALGVIEVIFRLVEYLRPENTGLPLNMTSIGLRWFIFVSELNNPSNSNQRNETISNDLHLSCVKEYKVINSEEKLVKLEYNAIETLQLKGSNKKIPKQNLDEYKNIELENSGKNFNTEMHDNQESFIGRDHLSYSGAQIEKYFALVTGDGKTIKNLSVYQSLEKSMRFLNNFIAESSILNLVCEIIIHNSKGTINENLYILKLRSLNILEEIINLAFSANINIIGCFKTKIIDKVKPYLSKFCKFIILKYENNANKGETCYLVSLLTVIKIILVYDESHELINNLDCDFWVWLLDLFIKKRENSHTSVQCKTIFELGFRFGSCSTLEILFNSVKLVDRLSKFIYDGTDLDGCYIEEKESSNKKTGKKRRIFGSVNSLFMTLGRYYDDLLKVVLHSNLSETIKEIIKRMIFSQFSKYGKEIDNTIEFVSLVIEHELEMIKMSQSSEKYEFASSIDIDQQKIVSLLTNLSCSTKFHRFVKTYRSTNKTSSSQNSFSIAENLDNRSTKNMENSSKSPNSKQNKYLDSEEFPDFHEIDTSSAQLLSEILRTYFTGNIIDLFKCDENCECPKWSFCNIFDNLIIEKNHFNGISVFPILPLEESKKIRETRKRQMKLYSSIPKND